VRPEDRSLAQDLQNADSRHRSQGVGRDLGLVRLLLAAATTAFATAAASRDLRQPWVGDRLDPDGGR
jgi:hypothetical protein